MAQSNKENFLRKHIHTESNDKAQERLIICAPVSDDADYEWIVGLAVDEAIKPFKNWFKENDIPHVFEINWGSPWLDEQAGHLFCINVTCRPEGRTLTKEESMVFELKFNGKFPILNITEYVERAMKNDNR